MVKELPEYEYIRRADAVFALTNSETQAALKGMSGADAYNEVLWILNGMPAADVAPVRHAKWEVIVGSDGKEHMVCTGCRKQQDLTGVFAYCPNCGAKMDLEG